MQFKSTHKKTSLIELFTSEGCSSCPPADAWMGSLANSPRLWKEFVPVAFHVTYWDYLGWNDAMADKSYADYQYRYASYWNQRSVYTPGVVLNGQPWKEWQRGKAIKPSNQTVGLLEATSSDGSTFAIRFTDHNKGLELLEIHATLLGMNIRTSVKAGENRGRNLEHSFVVMDWKSEKIAPDGQGIYKMNVTFDNTKSQKLNPKRQSVAFWITDLKTGEPIQAIGGYLSS